MELWQGGYPSEIWVIICSCWHSWKRSHPVWSLLLSSLIPPARRGSPLIHTSPGHRGWVCCFHPNLGRGTPCGCLWQIYVDMRGSRFHSGIVLLLTLYPGKRDRFLPFHCVCHCTPPSGRPEHLLPGAPPSAPENLFQPLGQKAVHLQKQARSQSLLHCFCTSILWVFLWGLDLCTNQRKCLVSLFRPHHLFPEAIRTQWKASGDTKE